MGYEDILDEVRTGRITEEEAKLKLTEVPREYGLSIKENAWYFYRYNLANFFIKHRISEPKFKTDKDGYMVHPETGQRLCPFSSKYGGTT